MANVNTRLDSTLLLGVGEASTRASKLLRDRITVSTFIYPLTLFEQCHHSITPSISSLGAAAAKTACAISLGCTGVAATDARASLPEAMPIAYTLDFNIRTGSALQWMFRAVLTVIHSTFSLGKSTSSCRMCIFTIA